VSQLAAGHVHSPQSNSWKRQLIEQAAEVFSEDQSAGKADTSTQDDLHRYRTIDGGTGFFGLWVLSVLHPSLKLIILTSSTRSIHTCSRALLSTGPIKWGGDVTYLPREKDFGYLVVIMDWHSRKVLNWRLSNTLDADFCVQALEPAILDYGCPQTFHTDHGAQFTAEALDPCP
jgi:transposase InsO family protein